MTSFNFDQIIKSDVPEDIADRASQGAWAIVRMVRLALENDSAGDVMSAHRMAYAADALEVAEALISLTTEGVEVLQRQANRGHWRQADAA